MKHIAIVVCLFLLSLSASAQNAAEQIAEKTCSCLKSIDTSAGSDIQTEFGLCMIKEAAPYEKELKKQYHIDLSQLDATSGAELGKTIAEKMLVKCPDQMARLAKSVLNASPDAPAADPGLTFIGTISDVSFNQFAVVTLKDAKGPDQKFLWLEYFKNSEMLSNPAEAKGKKVKLTYMEHSYYNPSIKDYMKFKVITGIEVTQ